MHQGDLSTTWISVAHPFARCLSPTVLFLSDICGIAHRPTQALVRNLQTSWNFGFPRELLVYDANGGEKILMRFCPFLFATLALELRQYVAFSWLSAANSSRLSEVQFLCFRVSNRWSGNVLFFVLRL